MNYEIYKRLQKMEADKASTEAKKQIAAPEYPLEDPVFRTFIETLALGTITTFGFTPGLDDIKKLVAEKIKKPFKSLPDFEGIEEMKKKEPERAATMRKNYDDADLELREAEL